MRHMPGHTPGLAIMQVNLEKEGTFIHTTDHYLVKENYEQNHAQGFLSRNHDGKSDNARARLSSDLIFISSSGGDEQRPDVC